LSSRELSLKSGFNYLNLGVKFVEQLWEETSWGWWLAFGICFDVDLGLGRIVKQKKELWNGEEKVLNEKFSKSIRLSL